MMLRYVFPSIANNNFFVFIKQKVENKKRTGTLKNPNDNEPEFTKLSDREIEVLKLVSSGLIIQQIADKLELADKTIDNLLYSIRSKLGARTTSQAIYIATKYKLI